MTDSTEQRLKDYLDQQLAAQNKLILGVGAKVDTLKDAMNGRIQKLELKQAYREGVEKAASAVTVVADGGDWKKLTFKLIGLLVGIVTLASAAAALIAKVILK